MIAPLEVKDSNKHMCMFSFYLFPQDKIPELIVR